MSETIFLGCGKVKDPARSVIDGNFVPVAIFQGDGLINGAYTFSETCAMLDNPLAIGNETALAHALNDLAMALETGAWKNWPVTNMQSPVAAVPPSSGVTEESLEVALKCRNTRFDLSQLLKVTFEGVTLGDNGQILAVLQTERGPVTANRATLMSLWDNMMLSPNHANSRDQVGLAESKVFTCELIKRTLSNGVGHKLSENVVRREDLTEFAQGELYREFEEADRATYRFVPVPDEGELVRRAKPLLPTYEAR